MAEVVNSPLVDDERLAELIRWTGESGMPDIHAFLLELQQRRAAQYAGAAEVRRVVREVCEEAFRQYGDCMLNSHDVGGTIADRVASQLTAPVTVLPPHKEWDAEAHADIEYLLSCGLEPRNEIDSSDYVDGWNDALEAVSAAAGIVGTDDGPARKLGAATVRTPVERSK